MDFSFKWRIAYPINLILALFQIVLAVKMLRI